jgi:hypothetical protein
MGALPPRLGRLHPLLGPMIPLLGPSAPRGGGLPPRPGPASPGAGSSRPVGDATEFFGDATAWCVGSTAGSEARSRGFGDAKGVCVRASSPVEGGNPRSRGAGRPLAGPTAPPPGASGELVSARSSNRFKDRPPRRFQPGQAAYPFKAAPKRIQLGACCQPKFSRNLKNQFKKWASSSIISSPDRPANWKPCRNHNRGGCKSRHNRAAGEPIPGGGANWPRREANRH